MAKRALKQAMERVQQAEADDLLLEDDEEPVDMGPVGRRIVWTKLGEDARAHSEHGTHQAGDEIISEHAEILIERGFAVPA